jgi:bifunctional UDP-N-acetylglucosamine pyrophosphorylase/glucosamine-1-phosphate N-acetyltransferase
MSASAETVAIVLAAGQGTRMKSALPKVLHPLLGRPMISFPVQAALDAGCSRVVCVLGHGRELVAAELAQRFGARVLCAVQAEQRGTGDAARCGALAVPDHRGRLLILNGDAALISAAPLTPLIERSQSAGTKLGMLVSHLPDATGYGRVLRDGQGRVCAIREQKDCSSSEAAIQEWNPGIYVMDAGFFRDAVAKLSTDNAQGELLLTDLVAMAAAQGGVTDVSWPEAELQGVNDRNELCARERQLNLRLCHEHGKRGVTIRNPETVAIDLDVVIEPDVTIEAAVQLRGRCTIARGAHIDVGCVLRDVTVAEEALVQPYTVATRSAIGARTQVGPFSHLRPESVLEEGAHMGNFVETKKTRLGRNSKANHLAYLGDSVIGENANIGAGTIFCNYDGFQKHTTVIEDGVFVGSDSQVVAPVTIGKDAYIATGTTVTTDVPQDALAIGRARQVNKEGLGARLRAKLKAEAERAKKK